MLHAEERRGREARPSRRSACASTRRRVTDEETVSEQVRKEQIEPDGDVGQRFRTEDDIARDRR